MTTYIISKTDEEIRGKSFVYVIMKKIIGDENAEAAISKIIDTIKKMIIVIFIKYTYGHKRIKQN